MYIVLTLSLKLIFPADHPVLCIKVAPPLCIMNYELYIMNHALIGTY